MAVDLNDEILQDFLVEAGEILELLGEQLVELEQSPDNLDLLNAIFRGFHTIKGGAGFLALDSLVTVCHKAEDIFDILRLGERKVTAELMDVILEVVDTVNVMFDQIRGGNDPDEADPSLVSRLQSHTRDGAAEAPAAPVVEEKTEVVAEAEKEPDSNYNSAASAASDIVEQEFGAMLGDVADTPAKKEPSLSSSAEITEEEFDNLLDDLHGKGQFSASQLKDDGKEEKVEKEEGKITKPPVNSGDITEEEFDNLLDELHGKGSFSAKNMQDENKTESTTPAENSASKEQAPAEKAVDKTPEKIEAAPAVKEEKKAPAVAEKNKAKPTVSAPAETTVRVDTNILDDIMNMVGELVLVRNRFQTLKTTLEIEDSEPMTKAVSNLDVVTADLQLAVMKTRMQPIKKVFGRFPRVVRDLSRSMKKEIKLELVGEETDLDKNLVEALADPLVHLVRNAVDHGIELPAEREATGKPREGTVVLTASQEGDHIQLTIKDDGKGMNADVLRKVVVEKGLMDEETAARLDDKECFNLIFMPGFSTKLEISDVSGRGVGMDVVKNRITQMNGIVEIDSVEGEGSTIIIKVPLTLAIMPTLMVVLGGQAFALPLASVLEILDLDLKTTNIVDGQLVIMVRERALPLFFLSDWLVNDPAYTADKQTTGHVVVVNASGRQVGFVVDQLIGQEEVVIKPLGAKLQGLDGLAGATITGDGKIALILDVPGLMQRYVG